MKQCGAIFFSGLFFENNSFSNLNGLMFGIKQKLQWLDTVVALRNLDFKQRNPSVAPTLQDNNINPFKQGIQQKNDQKKCYAKQL